MRAVAAAPWAFECEVTSWPVAVFKKSSARFGVGGVRSAARRFGEVFLRARRRGHEGFGGTGFAARCHGKALLRARRGGQERGPGKVFFGASRRVRGREARRSLQPGDVRSSLRQRGEIFSPATCGVLFGARWRARARRYTTFSPARCSACRRGRRRGGLHVHNQASWRCVPRCVSAWAKAQLPE